jgi:spermidine synthase
MFSHDDTSVRALSELGCAHINRRKPAHVLVGGLGMGYTLRAALDCAGPRTTVEVAEYAPAVVEWNRNHFGYLASDPLDDERAALFVGDVGERIGKARGEFDAILLDVDNGPEALAHTHNSGLYNDRGLSAAWAALKPGGVLAVWSGGDDPEFTRRLERHGVAVEVHKVARLRKRSGRFHFIWIAKTT